VVVALPRGGVPVGYEVAKALDAPLDIGLVRKLGAPMQPELGIGALGEGGRAVLDTAAVNKLRISREELAEIVEREQRELERRRRRYRPTHPPIDVNRRTVILVDDGLATGVTAVAAARVLRAQGAREVILAVPTCPRHVGVELRAEFDGFVCLTSPDPFYGVGGAYVDFTQTTDREVLELLAAANGRAGEAAGSVRSGDDAAAITETDLAIPARDGLELKGTLRVPADPVGLVIFVHGSGSSRLSPRNRAVAERLNVEGLATLLFDLLTEDEARTRANVFDVDLLADRLVGAHRWVEGAPEVGGLPVGLFGASTGAAAALRAAAEPGERVAAVASRGGRPDLAASALPHVTAPTLLIVGGEDRTVLELNRQAARMLGGQHEVAVVPGAGHLFEEPGALEHVSRLAATWFTEHFASASTKHRQTTAAGEGR
jgi:predicted phosphoribosyltransferase/dienelactone hydrolase